MPLPQQPTPQRRRNNDPKPQNIRATVTICIHQEVLNSQLVHRPQRELLRRLPRPSRGDPSARSDDSLAFALTGDNATASPQLDEPTWP